MAAYYNEIDQFAAEWLRELIKAGHIADGEVDERSIDDIRHSDLTGFTQCHFFAGIGGWSYALRLAGWPDDRPVWTGSCPCQPFSSAGKGGGFDDERHLWPSFFWLIQQCRPVTILGEQVASKSALSWLDLVFDDMEGSGYACGAANLPASSVGARHRRERIFWTSTNTNKDRRQRRERAEPHGQTQFRDAEFARLVSDALRVSVPTGKRGAVADGLPSRVGQLRGYGNAIVPQVAAEFIKAVMEVV